MNHPTTEALIGQRFGRLVILEQRDRLVLAQCDCGQRKEIVRYSVLSGATQSCGCLQRERQRARREPPPTGKRFGKLTILGPGVDDNHLEARCDCGRTKQVNRGGVLRGATTSCGCLRLEVLHGKRMDLTGRRFGRWLVVNEGDPIERRRRWLCRCDCGNESLVNQGDLIEEKSVSCGCFQLECITKHGNAKGGTQTAEYMTYNTMLARCDPKNAHVYTGHAGRGITVCDRWRGEHGFEHFLADVGPRPSTKHSIDRIDNEGNYEPNNVRWATARQQSMNRRDNIRVTYQGEQVLLAELARSRGADPTLVCHRVKCQGWDIDRALTTPRRHRAMGTPGRRPSLSVEQSLEVVRRHQQGEAQHRLAAEFGVSRSCIKSTLSRATKVSSSV